VLNKILTEIFLFTVSVFVGDSISHNPTVMPAHQPIKNAYKRAYRLQRRGAVQPVLSRRSADGFVSQMAGFVSQMALSLFVCVSCTWVWFPFRVGLPRGWHSNFRTFKSPNSYTALKEIEAVCCRNDRTDICLCRFASSIWDLWRCKPRLPFSIIASHHLFVARQSEAVR
jgi:hypothetical protein